MLEIDQNKQDDSKDQEDSSSSSSSPQALTDFSPQK